MQLWLLQGGIHIQCVKGALQIENQTQDVSNNNKTPKEAGVPTRVSTQMLKQGGWPVADFHWHILIIILTETFLLHWHVETYARKKTSVSYFTNMM